MSRQRGAMPTYEIVRTNAGWHTRFRAINGQVVWTTEVYTRRRGALAAIRSINSIHYAWVEDFWWDDIQARGLGLCSLESRDSWNKTNYPIARIRDIDERGASRVDSLVAAQDAKLLAHPGTCPVLDCILERSHVGVHQIIPDYDIARAQAVARTTEEQP
jgi:uncharacterized protein YegP (UPF0339 family)